MAVVKWRAGAAIATIVTCLRTATAGEPNAFWPPVGKFTSLSPTGSLPFGPEYITMAVCGGNSMVGVNRGIRNSRPRGEGAVVAAIIDRVDANHALDRALMVVKPSDLVFESPTALTNLSQGRLAAVTYSGIDIWENLQSVSNGDGPTFILNGSSTHSIISLPDGGIAGASGGHVDVWAKAQLVPMTGGIRPSTSLRIICDYLVSLDAAAAIACVRKEEGRVEILRNWASAKADAAPDCTLNASGPIESLIILGLGLGAVIRSLDVFHGVDLWADVTQAGCGLTHRRKLNISFMPSPESVLISVLTDGRVVMLCELPNLWERDGLFWIWPNALAVHAGLSPSRLRFDQAWWGRFDTKMVALSDGGLVVASGDAKEAQLEDAFDDACRIMIWSKSMLDENDSVPYFKRCLRSNVMVGLSKGGLAVLVDPIQGTAGTGIELWPDFLAAAKISNKMITRTVTTLRDRFTWPTIAVPLPPCGMAIGTGMNSIEIWPDLSTTKDINHSSTIIKFPHPPWFLGGCWLDYHRMECSVKAIVPLRRGLLACATHAVTIISIYLHVDDCFVWPNLTVEKMVSPDLREPEVKELAMPKGDRSVVDWAVLAFDAVALAIALGIDESGVFTRQAIYIWKDVFAAAELGTRSGIQLLASLKLTKLVAYSTYLVAGNSDGTIDIWDDVMRMTPRIGIKPSRTLLASGPVLSFVVGPQAGLGVATPNGLDYFTSLTTAYSLSLPLAFKRECTTFAVLASGAIGCSNLLFGSFPCLPGTFSKKFDPVCEPCPSGWRSLPEEGACEYLEGLRSVSIAMAVVLVVGTIWLTSNGSLMRLICPRRFPTSFDLPKKFQEIWRSVSRQPQGVRCWQARDFLHRVIVMSSSFGGKHLFMLVLGAFTVANTTAQLVSMPSMDAVRGFVSVACFIGSLQCVVSGAACIVASGIAPGCVVPWIDRHYRLLIFLRDAALSMKFLMLCMPLGENTTIMDVGYYWQCNVPSLCPHECTSALNGVCTVDTDHHKCLCMPSRTTWQKVLTIGNCLFSVAVSFGGSACSSFKLRKTPSFMDRNQRPCTTLVATSVLAVTSTALQLIFTWHVTTAPQTCIERMDVVYLVVVVFFVDLLVNEISLCYSGFDVEPRTYAALHTHLGVVLIRPLTIIVAAVSAYANSKFAADRHLCDQLWLQLSSMILILVVVAAICMEPTVSVSKSEAFLEPDVMMAAPLHAVTPDGTAA